VRTRHLSLIVILCLAVLPSAAWAIPAIRDRATPYPEYVLTLILKEQTGAPIDARVSVLDPVSGHCYGPADPTEAVYESWSGHRFFYARDRVEVIVPLGPLRILVAKGPEYTYSDEVIEVLRDRTYTVQLQRLIDPTEYGWFSGDTHVHQAHGGTGAAYTIDNQEMARVARAEDINVTCVLTNGPNFNGGIDPASDARHLLHYGIEYRSALYGHMGLLGMKSLIPTTCCLPGYPAFPLNSTICDAAHAQGATVVSSHPLPMDPAQFMTTILDWPYSGFARELPVDALSGGIDAVDIFSYSNYSDSAARQLWFDLLNLGLRLPLSVGTDASVNRYFDSPVGGYRVYVRPQGPFSLDSWLEGLRAGRSFATNGPLVLDFSLDRRRPGEVVRFSSDGYQTVKGHLLLYSREPLEKVEIYVSGLQIAAYNLPSKRGWFVHDFMLSLKAEPSWVVARVTGTKTAPPTVGRTEQAITSPIYLEAPDRRFEPKFQSLQRFDTWIRDLQTLVMDREVWADPGQMFRVWNDIEAVRLRLHGRPDGDVEPPVVERPLDPDAIAVTRLDRGTSHQFRATGTGEAVLEIFDVAGRLVRVTEARSLPAVFTWDSIGQTGPVPAGLYFGRVRGSSATSSVQRVLVLR
jgi:TolB protein